MKVVEASGTRRATEPVDQKRASSLPRYLCSSGLLLFKQMQLAGVRHAAGGFPMTQTANQELTTEWLTYSGHDLASLTLN